MTQPSPEQIQDWADAFLKGSISPEDKERFLVWYRALPETELAWKDGNIPDSEALRLSMLGNIRAHMDGAAALPVADKGRRRVLTRYAAAAAIILLLGAGGYLLLARRSTVQPPPPLADIAPGHDGAVLTLADGSTVLLDSTANGQVAVQGGTRVLKQNGQLAYNGGQARTGAPSYNTMTTPRGRQYKLVLPDGTRVWLNAASTIRFPVAFDRDSRVVEVTGEAYFEVKHDRSKPFIVQNEGNEVLVLGTQFDIKAYQEDAIQVTLLDGSVKVSQSGTHASALLRPGQQASMPQQPNARVIEVRSDVNLDQVMAWKNGYFDFEQQPITAIMQELRRWYDVDMDYDGDMPVDLFSGIIKRNNNISQVLQMFERTKRVHFTIDNKKITIKK